MMAVVVLIVFWIGVYLLDLLLKANQLTQERYIVWNINSGISLGLLKIKWFTKSFNKYFLCLGNLKWFPWTLWFSCGVVLSLSALVFGVALLILLVFNTISQRVVEHEVLTPVVPGINVPFSHMGFLISSIIIAGIVHEMGHAIAAIKEGVRVDGFGLIFFVVYPGAFTNINTGDLESLDPTRKLRIFSAGNWHNFVTLVIGFGLLNVLPVLLLPFYSTGNGVLVNYLSQNSVLTGKLGLYHGDVITRVNNCPVLRQNDWYDCMRTIQRQSGNVSSGYCLPASRIRQLDISAGFRTRTVWGNIDCCSNLTRSHLCFRYTVTGPMIQASGSGANVRLSPQLVFTGPPRYACLPVRTVTERPSCSLNVHCHPHSARPDLTCLSPSLENSSRLVRLVHSRAAPVLFLGNVNDLLRTVAVSNYIPRWNLLPYGLPFYLETFLSYLVAISGALILFNSVPCYSLDGQWILQAAVDLLLTGLLPSREQRRRLCQVATTMGSLLILTNVTMSIYFLLRQHVDPF